MPLRPATSSSALALLILAAAACTGGQSTDDVVGGDPGAPGRPSSMQPSSICQPALEPIPAPDAELTASLDGLERSYDFAGRWGTPTLQVPFTPAEQDLVGTLTLELDRSTLQRHVTCNPGVEVVARVGFATADGGFDEVGLEGSVLLRDGGTRVTVDGAPAPFVADLTATLPLGSHAGSFAWDASGDFIYGERATLRAMLTPYGTSGSLLGSLVLREPPVGDNGTMAATAPPGDLLHWPASDAGCAGGIGEETRYGYGAPLALSGGEPLDALAAAIEALAQTPLPASYADGSATEATVRVDAPTVACGNGPDLPSMVRVTTADGRLDLRFAVALVPSYSLLHYNTRTDLPWALPAARFEAEQATAGIALDGIAHVGVESWLDLMRTGERRGGLTLLGYAAGDCGLCDDAGVCIECRFDARVPLLELAMGSEAAVDAGEASGDAEASGAGDGDDAGVP